MNKRYAPVSFFLLALLALIATLYYRVEISSVEQQAFHTLSQIIEIKSKGVLHWLHERQGDAQIWSSSRNLAARLEQFLLQPDNHRHKSILRSRMEIMLDSYAYNAVLLLDSTGKPLLSTGATGPLAPATAQKLKKSLNKGTIEHTDFYLSPAQTVCIDWIVPLFREQNESTQAIAAVILQVDTSHYLFPLIQSQFSPFKSQKIDLFAINGPHSVQITAPGGPTIRTMLTAPTLAEKGIDGQMKDSDQGETGLGSNAEGVEVLFAHSQIPGTPWHLIAEVHRREIHKPVFMMMLRITGIILFALMVSTFTLWRQFRQQQKIQRLELEKDHLLVTKQAEEAIRENENKLRTITEAARDCVIMIDNAGKISFWNPAAATLFGYASEEIMGQDVHAILAAPQYRESAFRAFPAWQKTGQGSAINTTIELEAVKKGGALFPIELSISSVILKEKWVAVGIIKDISERKQAQRKLEDSEKRFRALFDESGQALLVIKDGRFINANRAILDMLGYDALEEFLDITPDTISPEFQPDGQRSDHKSREMIEKAILQGTHRFEWEHIKKDGSHFFADIMLNHIKIDHQSLIYCTWSDITEHKKLEKQSKHYEAIIQASDDAIVSETLDGIILSWNPGAEKMFGYTADEMIGSSIERLLPKDFADEEQWIYEQLLQGKTVDHLETLRMRKDGSLITISATISPIYGDNHRIIALAKIARDITDQRRITASLEEQRVQLKTLVETIPDLIWLKDINGVFLYCNHRFEQFLGTTADNIIGKTDYDFVDHDLADFFREKDWVAMHNDRPTKNEEWLTFASDGHKELLETTKAPLKDEQGEIIGILGIGHDITARKKDEARLNQLSQVVEQSGNIVVITDLNGTIEYVNPRFTERTGYTREDVLGRNPRILKSDKTPNILYAELWETLKQGKSWRGEFINRCKDGRLITESALITPLRNEQGEITHYVATKEDITQKKQTELELENYRLHLESIVKRRTKELEQAKHQAETANQAKSTFLANMSHEIRTPLNAIIGFAHLVGNQVQEQDQQNKVNKIIDSGKHLLGIINDILDLSKIEAKSMQLEERTFLVPAAIDQACTMMRERVKEKGLRLVIEMAPQLTNLPLKGDELRLRQIVVNYFGNAIKFTDHGSITLRARILEENEKDVLLRFEVVDTGIGISEAQQNRLFHAFEQAEASTMRKYGGTGLGLTISKHLAEMMGGETGLISALGQGSTFWFTTRMQLGEAKDLQTERTDLSPLIGLRQGARILLVEDNEINQEVATEILERFGLSVEIAANGEEGCQKVAANEYDLVLMDMQMPVLDGVEATRRIRLMPERQNLPIVAMTANAFEDDKKRCEVAGMNGFVAKPVEPDQLHITLARWLAEPSCPYPRPTIEETGVDPVAYAPSPAAHINQQTGIKFTGSLSTFQHMLGKFIEQQADLAERIEGALQVKDFDSAQRAAHSLKGVAAMLGMLKLRELALSLEQALRYPGDKKEIFTGLDRLTTELLAVLVEANEISRRYAEENDNLDRAHLQTLVFELHDQLTQEAPQAADTWQQLEPIFAEVLEACDYDLLKEQLEQAAYPEALITLNEIREEYDELELMNNPG